MELFLNLAWLAVAAAIVCHWLRSAKPTGRERRQQLVAILVLIAILFPVISVSDDLVAVQGATESDTCLRRQPVFLSGGHPVQPPVGILPFLLLTAIVLPPIHYSSLSCIELKASPAHLAIPHKRPPPSA